MYGTPSGDYKFYDGFYAEYSLRQIEPDLHEIASPMTGYCWLIHDFFFASFFYSHKTFNVNSILL